MSANTTNKPIEAHLVSDAVGPALRTHPFYPMADKFNSMISGTPSAEAMSHLRPIGAIIQYKDKYEREIVAPQFVPNGTSLTFSYREMPPRLERSKPLADMACPSAIRDGSGEPAAWQIHQLLKVI